MDPISHGVFGAAAAMAILGKRGQRMAAVCGALAGMSPDLDVLLYAKDDPLAGWLLHRGFTHALVFIPVAAAVCAGLFSLVPRWRQRWKDVFLACLIGVSLHGFLDACTSYGTMILWPFSDRRVAFDVIGIVDLFFTPVLALGVIVGAIVQKPLPARIAFAFAWLYLAMGAINHGRAEAAARELAKLRGHEIERIRTMPSPGALVLWRTSYIADGMIWGDAQRTPYFRETLVSPGISVPLVTEEQLPERIRNSPQAMRAFRVFRWFADGFIAWVPDTVDTLGDYRYLSNNKSAVPFWGFRLDPDLKHGGDRPRLRDRGDRSQREWDLLTKGDPSYRPLSQLREDFAPEGS